MNEYKVSIIIPMFNVEKYIKGTLENVINQTLSEIEIICIDDFSEDDTLKIVQEYQRQDKRIKLIRFSSNKGQACARNSALKEANGKYIYFLDADDSILPEAMEELYESAESEQVEGILFDAKVSSETERLRKIYGDNDATVRKNKYQGIQKGSELLIQFVKNKEVYASPCRQFWNRNFLVKNNLFYFDGIRYQEDALFFFRAMIKAERIHCISKIYFFQNHREGSTSSSPISYINFEGVFICYCQMVKCWLSMTGEKSPDIADYIASKYKWAKRIYGEVDIPENMVGSWYWSEELAKQYFLFKEKNKKEFFTHDSISEKVKEIRNSEKIVIYGAGAAARELLDLLDEYEVGIYCFAVKSLKENPRYCRGIKVKKIDNIAEMKKEVTILVGVNAKKKEGVRKELIELGFEKIICFN